MTAPIETATPEQVASCILALKRHIDRLEAEGRRKEEQLQDARAWARAWKESARANHDAYQNQFLNAEVLSRRLQDAREENQRKDAEIKRLRELQPCGHPTAAIFTGEARGDDCVNYCGWCAEVGRLREALDLVTLCPRCGSCRMLARAALKGTDDG